MYNNENESRAYKIFTAIKENKSIILMISTMIGIVLLMGRVTNILDEVKNQEKVVQNWYQQLPDEHWIKIDDDYGFNESTYQIMSLLNSMKGYITGSLNLSFESMGVEGGQAGKLMAFVLKREQSNNKQKYELVTTENNKKIGIFNRLKLKEGDSIALAFYYDKNKMSFDFSEKEFLDNIQFLQSAFIYSYIEDPNIATIYDGKLTAVNRGTTKLVISCGRYLFHYDVKVIG